MVPKIGKYTSEQMSLDVYHNEVEAVSKTNLDHIHRSFSHYLTSKKPVKSALSGNLPKCLVEGSALHCLLLTPEEFTKEFRVLPAGLNRKTREGRALYDHIIHEGKPVISSVVYMRIEAMVGSILKHPLASDLLKEGSPEISTIWEDEGMLCKCRADYLKPLVISDIKTCQDASYEAFQRAIIDHRYHVQGAYFLDGTKAVDGVEKDFILIAVEKEPPFAVAVYKLSSDYIELGREEYKKDLARYAYHIKNPEAWVGYDCRYQEMEAPRWAIKKFL
jgi:hypothetical protein